MSKDSKPGHQLRDYTLDKRGFFQGKLKEINDRYAEWADSLRDKKDINKQGFVNLENRGNEIEAESAKLKEIKAKIEADAAKNEMEEDNYDEDNSE